MAFLSCEPKTKFNPIKDAPREQEKTRDGTPKWEIQVIAMFRTAFGTVQNEVLWEHYLYTGDEKRLREHFPLIAGSVEFFLDTLQTDPKTGYLVTNPSHSPEVGHHEDGGENVSICAGPTMDMQILRDLFGAYASAAAVLGLDPDPRVARARDAPPGGRSPGRSTSGRGCWSPPRRTSGCRTCSCPPGRRRHVRPAPAVPDRR
ncbi:hypothetical protein OHA25_37210 [Nonomuraea sp. NBC_00507]